MDLAETIRKKASRLGFQRCRFAAATPPRHWAAYEAWLAKGYAGEMAYLEEQKHARESAARLLPKAETVISVVASYQCEETPAPDDQPRGTIARYARGKDYHHVVATKLRALAEFIRREALAEVKIRTCVDALPILERDYAMQSGAGFIGKNTMLITPGVGSFTVLGELLVSIAFPPDPEERSHCGRCRLCMDACPTHAIVDEYTIDARRCIAYLTIELRGPIPSEMRRSVGTMIFGCDLCQEVCPYNTQSSGNPIAELISRPDFDAPALIPLLSLGPARYRRWIRGTPLRRVRRGQFLRNVCVALGNVRDAAAVPALAQALRDRDRLVRGHAAWALGEIGGRDARLQLGEQEASEADSWVLDEIRTALGDRLRSTHEAEPTAHSC